MLPGMYVPAVLIEQGIDNRRHRLAAGQAIQRKRRRRAPAKVFVIKDDNRVAVQAVRTGSNCRTVSGS